MKIRGIHVLVLVGVVVVALIVYGSLQPPAPVPEPAVPATTAQPMAANTTTRTTMLAARSDKDGEFLKKIREAEKKVPPTEGEGTLPPANVDPSLLPQMSLDPPELLDMGIVPNEGSNNGEIKVYNKGKGNLIISRVAASCGCTYARIDESKKIIAPGQFSVVTISVDPKKIYGFESRKSVTIFSNDPAKGQARVEVLVKLTPEFILDPPDLDFGEVQKGPPVEKTIVLRQNTAEPIEVLELKPITRASDLDLSFEKRPEAQWAAPGKAEYTLTLRLPEDISPGPFNNQVTVRTTCKRVPAYQFPVKGKVVAFYSMQPANQLLVRHSPKPGERLPSKLTIRADKPFEILDLKSSTPDIVLAATPGPEPNSTIIEAELSPSVEASRMNEFITFAVKSEKETFKERVPVNISVMRPSVSPGIRRPPTPLPSITAEPGQAGPSAAQPAPYGAVGKPPTPPGAVQPKATTATPTPGV